MRNLRNLIGLSVAGALLATSATPAFAGGYGGISIGSGRGNVGYNVGIGSSWGSRGRYGGYRRHRHRDRVDAGDVIGALAIFGVIAAVASAASKSKNTTSRRDRDEDRYPEDRDRRSGSISTEDQAVDACAVAAEEKAGQTASVRDITNVSKVFGGWDVQGVVEERDGWRDRSADKRNFTCSVRLGRVDNVYIEAGRVAFAD